MRKASALAGDPIEVRRADDAVAVGAGMGERPVVGDRQHDVRTRCAGARRLARLRSRVATARERERQDERHEEGSGSWHGALSHEPFGPENLAAAPMRLRRCRGISHQLTAALRGA
jgi:hypothetical protein